MFSIRPFDYDNGDYRALVAVMNATWTDSPASVRFEQRTDQERNSDHFFRRLMAELDGLSLEPGRCVGYADVGHMPWAYHPQKVYLNILVHPDYRRQGIGSALYNRALELLASLDPISIDSGTREDQPDGISFMERRNFRPATRSSVSQLDPATFDPRPFSKMIKRVAADGIRIRTLRQLSESDAAYLHKLYQLQMDVSQDIPWHDEFTPQPYEGWLKAYQNNPDLLPDGYFVALDGDGYVGLSELWASQATDAILYTGLTGVRRAYRRRGIATALKVRAVNYARSQRCSRGGPPIIRTGNEESNPMLQLNLRLGFKEMPAWIAYVHQVEEPVPAG